MNPLQFLRNFKSDFIKGVDAQDLINISKDITCTKPRTVAIIA